LVSATYTVAKGTSFASLADALVSGGHRIESMGRTVAENARSVQRFLLSSANQRVHRMFTSVVASAQCSKGPGEPEFEAKWSRGGLTGRIVQDLLYFWQWLPGGCVAAPITVV
jgi:hypothetical protein